MFIEQKLGALKRMIKGEKSMASATDLGIRKIMIGEWKKKQTKIESLS